MTTDTNDKRPTHIIWQVSGENDNAFWTRMGAGWLNRDGKGISLRLDAVPLHGRLVIREVSEQDEAQATSERATGGKKGGQK
ncbi:MAG TPA: hypothetical protein VGN80_09615 [Devosiaceae bacterium]|nr:hypothetical protein [Devosiaceae bacterium]